MFEPHSNFGRLFKKFRLRSGFATLCEFGDELAKEGVVYEDSIFSHWQKGDRLPKDRNLLLTILNIFIKKGGVATVEEANLLLESASQRDLNKEELIIYFKNISNKASFTAPAELPNFIGRERYLKEICWHLLKRDTILIHGGAGVGKTYLAIKIAHILKDNFSEGVLWYRFDIRGVESILNDIARVFGEDVSRIKDKKTKSEIVKDLLVKKNVLLILDNIESYKDINLFLPTGKTRYPLLITSKYLYEQRERIKYIELHGFNERELVDLAKKILGVPFVLMNLNNIKQLGKLIEHSPLAATVLLKRIENAPNKLKTFLHHFKKEAANLYKVAYDNKTLYDSLNLSFKALTDEEQRVFISLGVFHGADFSKEAVAFVNQISTHEIYPKLSFLQRVSLIEQSNQGRYRLHPLIKIYTQNKIKDNNLYNKLALFYENLFTQCGRGIFANHDKVENELENIIGVFNKCFTTGFFKRNINMWQYLGLFLWDTGRWSQVEKYGYKVVRACKKIGDNNALASCYIDELSWLYFWQGNLKKAEICANLGLDIVVRIKDLKLIALANQRLGMVFQAKDQNKKARLFLKKSLVDFKQLKIWYRIANTFLYLGHTYKNEKNLIAAKKYYQKSLNCARKTPEHTGFAIALCYLGEIFLLQKNLYLASKYFTKALAIDKMRGRKSGIPWCLYGLGKVKQAQEKINESHELFLQAKKLFINLGIVEQVEKVNVDLNRLRRKVPK